MDISCGMASRGVPPVAGVWILSPSDAAQDVADMAVVPPPRVPKKKQAGTTAPLAPVGPPQAARQKALFEGSHLAWLSAS